MSAHYSEELINFIITSKNDLPLEELSIDKKKNDKRALKDFLNNKKVFNLGTIENSKNFLCNLEELVHSDINNKKKIYDMFPVKVRMKYLNKELKIIEDCIEDNENQEIWRDLLPHLKSLPIKKNNIKEEQKKFTKTIKLTHIIETVREKLNNIENEKNKFKETMKLEYEHKCEFYKNEMLKEFHKSDTYLEMKEDIDIEHSKFKNVCELLEEERNNNQSLKKEINKLNEKLKDYTDQENSLTMKSLEMNKSEREIREENKKLKKQVEKFKRMIMDEMN